jgi:hypothetical protein
MRWSLDVTITLFYLKHDPSVKIYFVIARDEAICLMSAASL